MITAVTSGIRVSIVTRFREEYCDFSENVFMFSYSISISNEGEYEVRLLRRKWRIFDSLFENQEVEGDGVIGVQPVIQLGESYQYQSACNILSELGSMLGEYTMERIIDGHRFKVTIPRFNLIVPRRMC